MYVARVPLRLRYIHAKEPPLSFAVCGRPLVGVAGLFAFSSCTKKNTMLSTNSHVKQ